MSESTASPNSSHDRIDDERADVEGRDRKKRANEAKHDHRDTDRGTRLPYELQEGREVSEGAYALSDGGGGLAGNAAKRIHLMAR